MSERVLHLDFETHSRLDLSRVGVENYIRDLGFAVTAIAWAFDSGGLQSRRYPHCALPDDIRAHIHAGGVIKAWNAAFEWNVLVHYFGVNVAHEQMDCVMQRALAYGLPGKLQDAGDAMGAGIVKDATARRLMLAMGKPKPDGSVWHLDQSAKAQGMLFDLEAYCRRDVEAERAIDGMIPPLHPFERAISRVDARINETGVMVDTMAVSDLMQAAQFERRKIDAECKLLTGGAVNSPGTETARMQAWLGKEGLVLPDLTKATVEKALKTAKGSVARALYLRQLSAKSSVAKLERMAAWASSYDQRARNLLQFYGAGRTGRWAGRGIQVQNLPRPAPGVMPEMVIGAVARSWSSLELFHVRPLEAISSSLRACLVASPGMVLVSIDLAQIEARVTAWLSGQADVLDAFRKGEDVYTLAAKKVGSHNRQLGKVLTLACGFGMGPDKFRETAAAAPYYIEMTDLEAQGYLYAWRNANANVVSFWATMQTAVAQSVQYPGSVVETGRKAVRVRTQGGVTEVRKPNGVKLVYHQMRQGQSGLVFEGVNGVTKKWGTERTYGGRLVENLVQSVARDVIAEALMQTPVPIMTIHDEIVWEQPAGEDHTWLVSLVEYGAPWTVGLPLAADLKISRRYGK